MINPDHFSLNWSRLPMDEETRPGDTDKTSVVLRFHQLGCIAQFGVWDVDLAVAILTPEWMDHFNVEISETKPPDFMVQFYEAAVQFIDAEIITTTLRIQGSGEYDGVRCDLKFLISISPGEKSILSVQVRNEETHELLNDGKWDTDLLENSSIDQYGIVRNAVQEIQELLKNHNQERNK